MSNQVLYGGGDAVRRKASDDVDARISELSERIRALETLVNNHVLTVLSELKLAVQVLDSRLWAVVAAVVIGVVAHVVASFLRR